MLVDEGLVREGMKVLVTNLGYPKAARFIMNIGRGKGDSVEEFHNMWKGKSVDEICLEIEKAKRKGEI
jgi:UDP-glucose 4-epimerase